MPEPGRVGTQPGTTGQRDHPPQMASEIDDLSQFIRTQVSADAPNATLTRAEFGHWLDRHFTLDAERFSDLLLAVSEALANAAEFAYIDAPQHGTMDVRAAYDIASDALAVTVKDRGRWHQRPPEIATQDRRYLTRGRGIPLMRALADQTIIDRTPQGTHVTLTWSNLTRPSSPA